MNTIGNITGKYDQAFLNETTDAQRTEPQAQQADEKKPERVQDDRVSLSQESRQLQTAKQAVAQTPDIRSDKVDALKQAVTEGSYEVNPEKVAEKMIGAIISEII